MAFKKSNYRSSKFNKKRRNIFYINIAVALIILSAIIYGLVYFSSHKSHRVEEIKIEGNVFVNSDEIRGIAESEIDGNYLFLFSKRSSLLIPRDKIEDSIIEKYTSIKDVDVKFGNLHTIEIYIEEYEPVAKWCNDRCFLMNNLGLIFLERPNNFKESLITFNDFIEGDPIGSTYISEKKFKNLLNFIDDINYHIFTLST